MRLIDAEKLQEKAYQMNFDMKITERELFVVNYLCENSSTIEAEPVRHGHWIKKEKVYQTLPNDSTYRWECSECNWADEHNEKMIVPYCWHCGARMDEVEK